MNILTTEQIAAYRETAKQSNHYSFTAVYVRTQDMLDLLDEVEASRLKIEQQNEAEWTRDEDKKRKL